MTDDSESIAVSEIIREMLLYGSILDGRLDAKAYTSGQDTIISSPGSLKNQIRFEFLSENAFEEIANSNQPSEISPRLVEFTKTGKEMDGRILISVVADEISSENLKVRIEELIKAEDSSSDLLTTRRSSEDGENTLFSNQN